MLKFYHYFYRYFSITLCDISALGTVRISA